MRSNLMRRLVVASLALMVFTLSSRSVQAAAIQLLNYEGGVQFSQSVPGGGIEIPQYLPMTLNYGPQGGSLTFDAGAINPGAGGLSAYANQTFPVSGQFFLNLGVPANSSNNSFAGPDLWISGQFTGTLTGPGSGGSAWRWSGGYSGTATSAILDPFSSQDPSQLPSPLLDILNHPDHLHFSVYVTGGDMNYLTATLTFDPPSPIPTPAPEPTSLITLVAGVAVVIYRRRKTRATE
jgi:hypothetical protein